MLYQAYSRLFGAPAKLRPGYANSAVDDPPLKLVLNSPGNWPGGTINHLGIEASPAGDVTQAEPGWWHRACLPSRAGSGLAA